AALRPQSTGMDREAMARQPVSSMVVELCRFEVQLHVRPLVNRARTADKRTRLRDVAHPRSGSRKQIAQGNGKLLPCIEVVRDRLRALVESAKIQVVVQAISDPFRRYDNAYAEGAQVIGWANSGQEQKVRRRYS